MMKKGNEPRKRFFTVRSASIVTLSVMAAVLIAMSMLILGCSGGSGQSTEPLPPDHFRGTVRDSVIVLDEKTMDALVTIEPGINKYTPASNSRRIEFAEGDVLVNSRGQGSILKVKKVIGERGDEVILETEQATLEDIFIDTEIAGLERFVLSPQNAMANAVTLREGVILDLSDPSRWTLRISPEHPVFEDDKFQVVMGGELTFGPQIDFLFRFGLFGLEYLKFGVGGEQTSNLEVTIRSKDPDSYAPFEQEIQLGSAAMGVKPIYIQGVPVYLAPTLNFKVGVKGGITGSMTVKESENINLYGGVQYSDFRWVPIAQVSPKFEGTPPNLDKTKKLQ